MHFIEDKAEKYYRPYDLPFMGYNNYSLVGEWFAYCHAGQKYNGSMLGTRGEDRGQEMGCVYSSHSALVLQKY